MTDETSETTPTAAAPAGPPAGPPSGPPSGNPTGPPAGPPAGPPTVPTEFPAAAEPDPKPRWRDRLLGFRSVVAVALASLVLGGLGGAAIGVAASGGDEGGDRGPGRMDIRDSDTDGDRGQRGGRGGLGSDQLPPGIPPEDDVQPDDSGATSGEGESGTNS